MLWYTLSAQIFDICLKKLGHICYVFLRLQCIYTEADVHSIYSVNKTESVIFIEPVHNKTYKMAYAPNEDLDQPGHLPVWSVSSLSAWSKFGSLAIMLLRNRASFYWHLGRVHSKDSDQTGQMPRLIWVFARWTCHFVGFAMWWLHLFGLCQAKVCLQTNIYCADSNHPAHAQSIIRALNLFLVHTFCVSKDSVSGQGRPWSACTDVQADLGLCCPHIPEDTFSHGMSHLVYFLLPSDSSFSEFTIYTLRHLNSLPYLS